MRPQAKRLNDQPSDPPEETAPQIRLKNPEFREVDRGPPEAGVGGGVLRDHERGIEPSPENTTMPHGYEQKSDLRADRRKRT